jgi:hypothetical protein
MPRSRGTSSTVRTSSGLATEPRGRASDAKRQRHGGNGHGDMVRLQMRGILRGVRTTPSRNGRVHPSIASANRRMPERRNAANPMIGSRMQQACTPPSGGNRRGGETPRGRNKIRSGTSNPKHGQLCGSGRSEDTSMEGRLPVVRARARSMANPTRGGRISDPGDNGALKESQVHEGRAACRQSDSRNSSKTTSVTSKVREEATKTNELLRGRVRVTGVFRKKGFAPTLPEEPVKSTRASVQTEKPCRFAIL